MAVRVWRRRLFYGTIAASNNSGPGPPWRESHVLQRGYLENKSDFFTAPASARYHLACEGGLCEHSLNVYHCLVDYLQRERVQELYGLEYSEESVAVVALLHDVCKVGCYKKGFRNVKNDATGQWERVPTYTFDDPLPYGHGEKSVYIVNGFIRLTREEAMAIRWHMGFSGTEDPPLPQPLEGPRQKNSQCSG